MPTITDQKTDDGVSPGMSRDASGFVTNPLGGNARSKSNRIEMPSVNLPKSGGAIKSIDEKFSVNAVNGTAAFALPLPFSNGRNGVTPELSLSYNSGGGNGIFGAGWAMGLSCIIRRTDKKLPEYKDEQDSDTFLLYGGEDLVPALAPDSSGAWKKVVSESPGMRVTRYRPRIEGAFSRIERVEELDNVYWRVKTKDNSTSVFGKSIQAKLSSPVPGQEDKVFKWCLEYSYDDKGNYTYYQYKKEDTAGVPATVNEKNRLNNTSCFTEIYLKSISYGNKIAWYEGDAPPTDYLFQLVLDYGEHDLQRPTTKEIQPWAIRRDPFSDYHPGFELRTYRLVRRVLMFHHFREELGWDDYLVRSMELGYDEQPHLTYLQSITQTGYIWNTDGSLRSALALPPLEMTYFKPGFSTEVHDLSSGSLYNLPEGLSSPHYQWMDLYSEGISGIVSEQAGALFYKENRGDGDFSPARAVSPRPSFQGLSNGSMFLQDLEGNGKRQLVNLEGPVKGYFPIDLSDGEWQSFYPFTSFPNIDVNDPNLKFVDLNGDGMPDMLFSQEQEFIWWASKGKEGYDEYHFVPMEGDEEKGPRLLFADRDERLLIALADMSGDGLSDLVLVTYAGVCYYPNLGYGRFGARVTMEMDGCFDAPDSFNTRLIHLTDIDGSGNADIVYLGKGRPEIWINQSGNSLKGPEETFASFPALDDLSRLSFIDLLGTGTMCMVWSSSLPSDSGRSLRYIDLTGGKKPHIMQSYKNNLGKEVQLEYISSTHYYLKDKKNGVQWVTKLPFPVQCVSKVTVTDKVSQTRLTNEYSYHHGYYDPVEREFRGFARVDQRDTEEFDAYVKATGSAGVLNTTEQDIYQPAVITRSWFHTGAFIRRDAGLRRLQDEYYSNSMVLPEEPLPAGLTGEEILEAYRALKGMPLRQEVYSDEGDSSLQEHPYSVRQTTYETRTLQPRAGQPYAVFLVSEKQVLSLNFERNPVDPRISHSINTVTDDLGNVLEAASIAYGRKIPDARLPTANDKARQSGNLVTYKLCTWTASIDVSNAYRLPLTCEEQTWELNAPAPVQTFYASEELRQLFSLAASRLYEQTTAVNEKRKVEHAVTLYLKDDLTGPMPFGSNGALALPYENYLLAFTPTLVQDLYGGKFDDAFWRNKAMFTRLNADSNYWVRSGKIYYYPDASAAPDTAFARSNFYRPAVYEDNFGGRTTVTADAYHYFIQQLVDPIGNEISVAGFNYRTLSAYLVQDTNDNRTGVRLNELGWVTAQFVMGKPGELRGDLMDLNSVETSDIDEPSRTMEYAFRYYATGGQRPDSVHTRMREQSYYVDPPPDQSSGGVQGWLNKLFGGSSGGTPIPAATARWQDSYAYSDGSGQLVLKKIQAEPGVAPQRDGQGNLVFDGSGRLVEVDTGSDLRWIGNGRTIYNNKGKPVKQYEPFFDSSPEYNSEAELVQLGFTKVLYYDATGRVIRAVHADGSFSQTLFDAWTQEIYDENDTILDSSWYADRIGGTLGEAEQSAAQKAAVHANTPVLLFMDPLGRTFLEMDHNKGQRSNEAGWEEYYYNRTELDIEGNARSITDARGNTVMSWKYDMLGNICCQHSMDAGDRWMLGDVMGRPLRLWDSRMQIFTHEYDALHRPFNLLVNTGAGDFCYERFRYGEGAASDKEHNLRGKLYQHFDTAGLMLYDAYDHAGNNLANTRQLLKDYKTMPDWNNSPVLESASFDVEMSYDAMNRPVQTIAPDGSVYLQQYNEAGLLDKVDVRVRGAAAATNFVSSIHHNAKGQREQIYYGNNTTTRYSYDPVNYRLTRMLTTADNGNTILQDLQYTYDPAGNITRQFDNAQKTIFYGGQQVGAQNDYIYDAVYQLIEAGGREHSGQIGLNAQDNFNDGWCKLSLQPNSPVQLRNYMQKYFYDGVGNILRMQHIAGASAGWTRAYTYNAADNHLIRSSVSGQNYTYAYNPHGSIQSMPHLGQMDWNFREELQHVSLGGGGDVYHVYDSAGNRVRKVVVKQGNKSAERIYLGIFEIYRERTGSSLTLERQTIHVMDDMSRIAMVESRTAGNDNSPKQLIRYQYGDQLGSAALELDDAGKIISYEEYHPFGTTAYQATDASRQVPVKRYRFTGMERDEETGFGYHHNRFYAPWLGRWTATDPIGVKGGTNLYGYVQNNPLRSSDREGTDNDKPSMAGAMFRMGFIMLTNQTPEQFGRGMVDKAKSVTVDPVMRLYGPGGMLDKAGQQLEQGIVEGKWHNVEVTQAEHDQWGRDIFQVGAATFPGVGEATVTLPGPPMAVPGQVMAVAPAVGTDVVIPGLVTQAPGIMLSVKASDGGGKKDDPAKDSKATEGAGKEKPGPDNKPDAKAAGAKPQVKGPGKWMTDNTNGLNMTSEQAQYQRQISGRPANQGYYVGGRQFDAFKDGKLVEAKHFADEGRFAKAYKNMDLGKFGDIEYLVDKGETILEQARAQVKVANGVPIEWNVSGKVAADALRRLFKAYDLPITVKYVPMQ